jgi:uncharacterized protein (DUF1778 family)
MSIAIKDLTRFDARLPKEQKQLFEKAALLGGYRNLTDFILLTVQEKAKKIIQENEQIIASENDAEIFFNAITHAKKPSARLKKALKEYEDFTSNSI